MEILSVGSVSDTVSSYHVWPVRDTLTTFQTAKTIRLLIVRNTKRIIPVWKQRDIFSCFPYFHCFLAISRNCTETVHAQTPVREQEVNAKLEHPFGSFGTWPGDPALVRNPVSRLTLFYLFSAVSDHFGFLSYMPDLARILAESSRKESILAESVNTAKKSQ